MTEVPSDMSTAPRTNTYAEFEAHVLDDGHRFYVGRLPGELCPDAAGCEVLWDLQLLQRGQAVMTLVSASPSCLAGRMTISTSRPVETTHRKTLKLVVDETNRIIGEHEAKQRREAERKAEELKRHEESVRDAAKRISFD